MTSIGGSRARRAEEKSFERDERILHSQRRNNESLEIENWIIIHSSSAVSRVCFKAIQAWGRGVGPGVHEETGRERGAVEARCGVRGDLLC